MKFSTRYVLVLLVGVFTGAAVTVGVAVLAEREQAKEARAPLPLDELRTFTEVFSRIKSDYVEPVEDKKLLGDAVQGMLTGLDPHSSYLDAESFKDVRVETEGQFGGLGIEVTMENGFVKVVAPIDDTPRGAPDIRTGDLIIRLDDKAVKGMTLNEAVRLMRGKVGTDITLTVAREGTTKPFKVTLKRAVIKIQSVKNKLLEPGYGYVRITQFQAGTERYLNDAVKLNAENKGRAARAGAGPAQQPGRRAQRRGGGERRVPEQGSDRLHRRPRGRFQAQVFRDPGRPPQRRPDRGAGQRRLGLGLGDRGRRVAGPQARRRHGHQDLRQGFGADDRAGFERRRAQAHHRALLHAERPLDQATGIVPDIAADEAKITKSEAGDRLREADLARHLEGGEAPAPKEEKKDDKKKEPGRVLAAADDYQLQEALNLLKGISFLQG